MKIEKANKLQNAFKSNLNETSRERYKSVEKNTILKSIKLPYESREAKLFNDYFSIVCEAKYKTIHGKGIPSMLARVARQAKVSAHSNLKILSPK